MDPWLADLRSVVNSGYGPPGLMFKVKEDSALRKRYWPIFGYIIFVLFSKNV